MVYPCLFYRPFPQPPMSSMCEMCENSGQFPPKAAHFFSVMLLIDIPLTVGGHSSRRLPFCCHCCWTISASGA